MAPAAADRDAAEEKSSRFRWIDAVRYAVASVVAVLIVAVIVNAVKVVSRPESLFFSVAGGCVPVARTLPSPEPTVVLELGLEARNPAGRARMYLVNVTGYLFDQNVSAASLLPHHDCVVSFLVRDKVVPQNKGVLATVHIKATKEYMPHGSYFDALYSGNGSTFFRDVTMRLDGTLITEVRSGWNASRRPTTYYCPQLLVGGASPDDEAFKNRQDVVCST